MLQATGGASRCLANARSTRGAARCLAEALGYQPHRHYKKGDGGESVGIKGHLVFGTQYGDIFTKEGWGVSAAKRVTS